MELEGFRPAGFGEFGVRQRRAHHKPGNPKLRGP